MKQNPAKRTKKTSKKAIKKAPVTSAAIAQQTFAAKPTLVIVVADKNLNIKNWNKDAQSLFGWSSKEVAGKQPDKLFQTVYPSSTTAAVLKKFKQTGSFSGGAILKDKNKQNIKVQLTITALFDTVGKLTGAVYLINQNALKGKTKTENLNNVFERVTDAFVAFDNDWRYTFVNKKAIEYLGKSKKQLIGKNVWDLFPADVDQPFYKALHKAKKTQKPLKLELYYPPFDRWYEDLIYPSANGISVYYHDITEKKKAILSLTESEEKYKGLIEQASDAIIIYSLDGTIYDFNKSAYEQTGYTKKEFQKLKVSDLLNNEEVILDPVIAESFNTGKPVLFERKLKLKDGSLVDTELNVRMLPDGKLLGIARNITERNKAITALKESEIRFRSLFEHASDGIYIADSEGKYVEVNESGCKLVDYTKEEISKLSIFDLVVKDENAIPLRIDEIKAGKQVIQQRQLRKKDGQIVTVEISSKLLPDGRMLGMVRDLSERLEIKNKLRKEKELSEKIINSLPGIFYLSNQTPRLVIWNKMFETLSGYSAEELKAIRPIHLFAAEDQAAVLQSLQKTYADGGADVEARLLTKSGEKIPFYFTGVRIEYNGELCILGTGINLTERKKAEEALTASENRLRTIYETEPECIKMLNEKGELIEMNPAGLEMIEADSLEMVKGKQVHGIVDKEYKQAFKQLTKNVFKNIPGKLEFRITGFKGGKRWLETNAVPFKDEKGHIISLLGITRDISERKKAEDDIKQMIERFQLIAKATNDAVWDWDLENNRIWWSDVFFEKFGFDKSQPASNELFKSNVFIDDREKTERSFKAALEENASTWTAEFRFLTKEGVLLTLSDKAFFLKNKEGKIYRVIGAMQDITRQKEEEKRISKATLDAQENERTQIGLELHDNINQILVGALLNLAMSSKVSLEKKQDIIDKVKSYIQSSISEIRKVSHRLAPVSFEDGSLKEAFEALLEDMNLENKFNIQLHVDEFDKNKVSGDIQKNLYRILQEQLNNILKYSQANFIEIEITNNDDNIKMKIYDNGIGFNPKEIKKGIGLNNIKKRAEAFSGSFHLNTSPGSGCKLEIEIPLIKI